ncbi:MAG TPA: hypothetical protein VG319_13600 [Polyangia bacterium]|nr:hypothetical protein [Polyangia bacterium]
MRTPSVSIYVAAPPCADAAPKIRTRVRATLGDGELTIGRGAYVGIGVA